jgi:hypothetical protein
MTKAVYERILAVQGEIGAVGISKDRRNAQQGYQFRGIDDMYNALNPLITKHGLVILPRMVERDMQERRSVKGAALFYATVKAEFDFVAPVDDSTHTVVTYGEAMDTADKATNKAMSAAYKYAVMQTFCIPTEGDNDADATTHEVQARGGDLPAAQSSAPEPANALALREAANTAIELFQAGQERRAYEQVAEFKRPAERQYIWQYLVNYPELRAGLQRQAAERLNAAIAATATMKKMENTNV